MNILEGCIGASAASSWNQEQAHGWKQDWCELELF
jgi:hypothetical protein